jgi:hypothetical protein
MADKQTTYYTNAAERAYSRAAAPSMKNIQKTMRFAEFDITLETGYLAVDDNYVLGKLGVDAVIFPTLSFLMGTSGSVGGAFRLEKVTAVAGSPTTVGANVTISTDYTPVAFGAAVGQVDADDYLQLTINTATAVANGDTLKLVVAYLVSDGSVN